MSDFVDKRGGAYDPVTKDGSAQPPQTPSQDTQRGADVRPKPLPGLDEGNYPLPEGLRKERKGPLNKETGRNPKPYKADALARDGNPSLETSFA
jgi:hypothetical protein